jgi:hypothetical protein
VLPHAIGRVPDDRLGGDRIDGCTAQQIGSRSPQALDRDALAIFA